MKFRDILKKKNKNYTFGGYILENIYNNIPVKTGEEIISFWLNEKILKEEEAKRRVNEVAFVIRDKDTEKIAGLNTVYIRESTELDLKQARFSYKMFSMSS